MPEAQRSPNLEIDPSLGPASAADSRNWRIPFPEGLIKQIPYPAAKAFDLDIDASGWKITDMALVGEKIEPWHLDARI